MRRLLHLIFCKIGWHSRPIYVARDAHLKAYCRWCYHELHVDPRGSLFE